MRRASERYGMGGPENPGLDGAVGWGIIVLGVGYFLVFGMIARWHYDNLDRAVDECVGRGFTEEACDALR